MMVESTVEDRSQRASKSRAKASASAAPAAQTVFADVAIVGAGIAGSLLALELGRQGLDVAIVDVNAVYPSDFRCEKLTPDQIAILKELDALDCLERAELEHRPAPLPGAPAPRKGLIDRGLRYDQMVNAIRGEWPANVRFVEGRVSDIFAQADGQRLTLESGAEVMSRLAVLASGPNEKLRAQLGVDRQMVREGQSVCVGFSLEPAEGSAFPFESLVHHGERPGDGVAFASLFPMGAATRVNLFVYHDPREGWTKAFREDPLAELLKALPGLKPMLAGARVASPVEIRATDLYQTEGHAMAGVVLIGEAFRSSCPATGMGVTRVLTDVRQLSRVHIPHWLASSMMGSATISKFYQDPVKRAVDAASARKARSGRLSATQKGMFWRLRRRVGSLARRWRHAGGGLGVVVKS
jgi:2-polyprenyl-6-methoxyphenol hydroxylase-like FAD-dependent oxidoreductase